MEGTSIDLGVHCLHCFAVNKRTVQFPLVDCWLTSKLLFYLINMPYHAFNFKKKKTIVQFTPGLILLSSTRIYSYKLWILTCA